jgi:tetratricopeptide (TPR) repeat protein
MRLRNFRYAFAMVVRAFAVVLTAAAWASSAPDASLARGLAALEASDYTTAEAELARVVGNGAAEAKRGLAVAALLRGKYTDAANFALAAKATAVRAQVLYETGRQPEAIRVLEPLARGSGSDARRARVLLGEYLIQAGRRGDAEAPLQEIIEEYNESKIAPSNAEGLAIVGRAAFLLRSPKDANTAYKESERADPKRVETLLWAAELFLDKYDPGHAEEELKIAYAVAPNRADVLVALAKLKLEQSLAFEEAERFVAQALTVHPNHAGALALRAGILFRDMDTKEGLRVIEQGLAVHPNNLELLSLKAAARFLDDDKPGFEAAKRDVFRRNASYARFFSIVGEFAEWEHRYDELTAMMKEAVVMDPDEGKAFADLGLTQLRNGNETAGLENLATSWGKDKFNVRAFNTLNLFERDIPRDYETVATGAFRIRYPKNERAILERYVPRMLDEAFSSMKARYEFTPSVPVQVELFATREAFSVRTSGLPNIGIQGVCFGRVIAALSPSAEPVNFGNVVWHELGHIFALQLSKNHVPRWFTEGLSEYETKIRRPEWTRWLDPELYAALKENKLPPATEMNRAFSHATNGADVTVAYYAASKRVAWTVERFGLPKVKEALKLWGQGKKTPEVLRTAFGLEADAYDREYRAWQMENLSRYANKYQLPSALPSVDEAAKRVQNAPSDGKAHAELAASLFQAGDAKGANEHMTLALSLSNDVDGYSTRLLLTASARAQHKDDAERTHLEAAHRFDASQSEPLKALLHLETTSRDARKTIELLQKLATLEPHDRAVWHALLEKLVAQGRWTDASRVGESAIYVDVMNAEIHTLYGTALAANNAHAEALYEFTTATLCASSQAARATAHALAARELIALSRAPEARIQRDKALQLDPANATARALSIP